MVVFHELQVFSVFLHRRCKLFLELLQRVGIIFSLNLDLSPETQLELEILVLLQQTRALYKSHTYQRVLCHWIRFAEIETLLLVLKKILLTYIHSKYLKHLDDLKHLISTPFAAKPFPEFFRKI